MSRSNKLYNRLKFLCLRTSVIFFSKMDLFTSLPHDTDQISYMRKLLFDLPIPFSLTIANYKLFWPLIDNVYVIEKTRHVEAQSGDFKRHLISCRFKRAYNVTPSSSLGPRASSTKRSKKQCTVSFRLLEYSDHVEFQLSGGNPFLHDHSLDESDANKRNSALRDHVQFDITRGYAPAAVIGSIRGKGQSEVEARLNAAGGAYLTRQDAINSGTCWRLANPNALFASRDSKSDVSIQVREAFEKLDSLKWLSASISAKSLDDIIGHGVVFAEPTRLNHLTRYGHLSLMDSTHKTNQLEWKLFTIMVRDKHACWLPVAHALMSNEFGELIAEFLLVVKNWVTWNLRYSLTDDSAAEIKAFRLAFPGLASGETEVSFSALNLIFI